MKAEGKKLRCRIVNALRELEVYEGLEGCTEPELWNYAADAFKYIPSIRRVLFVNWPYCGHIYVIKRGDIYHG